jgi:hypothetical protein
MLNQVILVGRVKSIDNQAGIVTINVTRKDEGSADLIPITLSEGLTETMNVYLKEDSTIGVKASIKVDNNFMRIIGEKVTFINTKND